MIASLRRPFSTGGLLLSLVLALPPLWLANAPIAQAADAVFPLGARAGLVPPAGFARSQTFRGYEDVDRKAAILMLELPAAAYAELEKTTNPEALKREGIAIDKRENLTFENGKGILLTGRQDSNGVAYRKWLLVASVSGLTVVTNVQIPDAAKDAYPDHVVRAALGSLKVRPEPVDEKIGLLPFELGELSGFRVLQADISAAILTDGPKSDIEGFDQSFVLLNVGRGSPSVAEDRDDFARQALATLPGFKEMRVTFAEAMRLGGQAGYEIRAEAKHAKTDHEVTIVQWLRFGVGGYLRMVAMVPKDHWAATFPKLRAIRDGLKPR